MGLREEVDQAATILRGVNQAADRAAGASRMDQGIREIAKAGVSFAEATLPDVNESPNEPAGDVPVHIAWQRVMGDVWWLGKGRQAREYKYRGIDDVMDLVGPAVRKHGVTVVPVGCTPTYEIINTAKGSPMNYCRTVARFRVYGPRGDFFDAETPGEAFDSGDKAGTKAQSVALRTFYIQALALMTNRPQLDPEFGDQHEIGGAKRPTPDEYAAEIMNERTSLARLHQIKAELAGDNSLRMAMIEGLDGKAIELGRLLQRVGAKRLAEEGGNA